MNHITNFGRVAAEVPKPLKRKFAEALKNDRATITEALVRLIELYINGKANIFPKRGSFR